MEPFGTPQLTLVTLNARITQNINLDHVIYVDWWWSGYYICEKLLVQLLETQICFGVVSGRESSVKPPNQTAAVTPRDKETVKNSDLKISISNYSYIVAVKRYILLTFLSLLPWMTPITHSCWKSHYSKQACFDHFALCSNRHVISVAVMSSVKTELAKQIILFQTLLLVWLSSGHYSKQCRWACAQQGAHSTCMQEEKTFFLKLKILLTKTFEHLHICLS